MIQNSQIVDRIKQEVAVGKFRTIGATNDFITTFEKTPLHPSCFVLPAAERVGTQNAMTQFTVQRVVVVFTIVMCFQVARGSEERGAADAEALREDLKDALLGWKPEGATDPIIYAGWRMLGLAPDALSIFYGMDVSTAYYERRAEQT